MSEAALNLKYINSTDHYSDGDSELELLSVFQNEDANNKIEAILNSNPTWPLLYHLSPLRRNLLSWYPFKSHGNLLEVGAGCGALTGLFCERLTHVTAVELTKLRAELIYYRHKSCSNLSIIAGNFNDFELDQKFDYVTCIGVLEYAGRFTKSVAPHKTFLSRLKNCLKPGGILILAIENKFGLKYWTGAREDHTGRLFDSLEDYPNVEGIQTFGKHELTCLLDSVGLNKINYYYPLPDYKLPVEIFSDIYPPTLKHNIRPGLLPTVDQSSPRENIFNEKLAMDNIIKNNSFDFFANSFLVLAEK